MEFLYLLQVLIYIKTIETLCEDWIPYNEFKSDDPTLYDKEQGKMEYEVWANNGWTKVKRVIRHRTDKTIYRINTHRGVVDVTEDILEDTAEKLERFRNDIVSCRDNILQTVQNKKLN